MTTKRYVDAVRYHLDFLEWITNNFNLSSTDIDLIIIEQINSRDYLNELEIKSIVELCLVTHAETLRGLNDN